MTGFQHSGKIANKYITFEKYSAQNYLFNNLNTITPFIANAN